MPKLLSTYVHGVIDYIAALTLIILPRLLNWSGPVTTLLTVMGVTTAVYSLVTRYELGAAKLLPMKGHLTLDALSGLALIMAAFLLPSNGNGEMAGLIVLGLFELGAALLTHTRSPLEATTSVGDNPSGVYDNPRGR
jgi:hypothetical protein